MEISGADDYEPVKFKKNIYKQSATKI